MVPNGSIITYVGQWPHGLLQSADDVVSGVSAELAAAGLPLRSPAQVNAGLATVAGGFFTVTLQLQTETGLDFGTTDDVVSLIRHAVYDVTGSFPVSDSIPYVQTPAGGVSTGQPGVTPVACLAGSSTDTTGAFSLSCWLRNLTTTGFTTVGVLAIAVVLGFFLFFAGAHRSE